MIGDILLDRSKRKPKDLMGRRHPGHKFLPGVFVFPGGRVAPADRVMVAAGTLDPLVERRLMQRVQRPSLQRARAMAMAAIRETFEETGLLLGSRDFGAPEAPADGPSTDAADALKSTGVTSGAFDRIEKMEAPQGKTASTTESKPPAPPPPPAPGEGMQKKP